VGQFDKLLGGYRQRTEKNDPISGELEPCSWAALGLSISIHVYMSRLMLPLVVAACFALCGAGIARATKMPFSAAVLNLVVLLIALMLFGFSIVPEIMHGVADSALRLRD
jgi:hypothetical protein